MLVEGVRAVEAAVEAGAPLVEVLVTEGARRDTRVAVITERVAVPVYAVSAREMERLSDVQTSQGILAVVRAERVEAEQLAGVQRLLVLDGVQDPGNVGAILRTAAWFGAEGVLGGRGTAGFSGPKVIRAAMGAHWDLQLARSKDLPHALRSLREQGIRLYGADLEGVPIRDWQPRPPSALILGSEAHGLSPEVKVLLDERVAIPSAPGRQGTESLNVAVSAGLLVYEWVGRGGETGSR